MKYEHNHHRRTKKALKYIFTKLGSLGQKLQRLEFRAKNFIEFRLYAVDREKFHK